ncbi:MAG: phosphoglucosamine mutase [Syntrophomonadaceae bacterium]|nr:phosphoglucosamine mutase [Syntrophomonadaceae bacterium]
MGALFGTDGVRGIANVELTAELAYDLGRAGAYVLARHDSGKRPRILVGKDTRISGDMLEAALIAGICSTGADALTVGVIPTPAIAYLTRKYEASCGIVISASHNPVEDNGIKFFGSTGYKLPDDIETEIEGLVLSGTADMPRPSGHDIGRVYGIEEADNNYMSFLSSCYDLEQSLEGLTLVVDCANGAAYSVGPEMWRRLGAKVIPIHDQPNGVNINDHCGSTHIEVLRQEVLNYGADIGIAYDGDADRCLAVDEQGNELDGDFLMMICALDLKQRGLLEPPQVVATVMSNIGLDITLRAEEVAIESCKVGDRYVLEKMLETGAIIGGEQSGHIIFRKYATTGDGLLTSLKLAEALKRSGLKLSQLAARMEKQPQKLVNVRIDNKEAVMNHHLVQAALQEAENRLGDNGKLVVRPSGTEPLVRIMAQGPDRVLLEEVIENIRLAVDQVSGGAS